MRHGHMDFTNHALRQCVVVDGDCGPHEEVPIDGRGKSLLDSETEVVALTALAKRPINIYMVYSKRFERHLETVVAIVSEFELFKEGDGWRAVSRVDEACFGGKSAALLRLRMEFDVGMGMRMMG